MRVKLGFVLREVGDEYIVTPIEERTKDFQGTIRLNKTSVFLWEQMKGEFAENDLVGALLRQYNISVDLAKTSVQSFLNQLVMAGVVER